MVGINHEVFISHSSKDYSKAKTICDALEAAGIACWIAPRNIHAPKTYDTEIMGAITTAKIIVLVETRNADKSDIVRREIERAVHYLKPVLRFRLEEFELKKLEFLVSICHFMDAVSEPLDSSIERLIARVKDTLIHGAGNEAEYLFKIAAFENRHRLLLAKSKECMLNYLGSFGKKHFRNAGSEVEPDLIPQINRCEDSSDVQPDHIAGKGGGHFLIYGDGGSGKSSLLLYLWQMLLKQQNSSQVEDFSPIPIAIPLSGLTIDHIAHDPEDLKGKMSNRPLSMYLKRETSFFSHTDATFSGAANLQPNYIQQEINYLKDCLRVQANADNSRETSPFFVLLLDGYNELRPNVRAAVDAEIIQLSRQGSNIQIILTTRHFISNALSDVFDRLELQGLSDSKVRQYLKRQSILPPQASKIYPLIKNPMILTLYCEGEKARVQYKNSNIRTLTLKDNDCVASILWNYLELSVKFRGIFEPYSDLQEQRERLYYVLSSVLPVLAWEMVSKGMHQIYKEDLLKKLMAHYPDQIISMEAKEIIRFLHEEVGLITCTEGDNAKVFFQHQNYRDFFAAVYISAVHSDEKKRFKAVKDNLEVHILPSEIASYVGELLNEHNDAPCGDSILLHLARAEPGSKSLIYNISEIYKALSLLDSTLGQFSNLDFSYINFIDVKKELVLDFVATILKQVEHEEIVREIVVKATQNNDTACPALMKVENVLRISLMAATDAKPRVARRFFEIWQTWVKDIYRYKAQIVTSILLVSAVSGGKSEDRLGSIVEKVFNSQKALLTSMVKRLVFRENGASFFDRIVAKRASSQVIKSLRGANLLQGEGHILSIFDEAEKKQAHLMILLDRLLEPPEINDALIEASFEVAKWNSIVANFVILNICHLLINDLGKGFKLVSQLHSKAISTDDPESKALVNWKIYSSINFTVQECKFKASAINTSACQFDDNRDQYINNFKPLMNAITADIVEGWIGGERPEDSYGFDYYFPLGVLAEFDMSIGDDFTKRLVIDAVFTESGLKNTSLLQRFIYETSCLAADSYHARFASYMEESFLTIIEITEMITGGYEKMKPGEQSAVKHSLFEAFSILFYLEPVQAAAHFNGLLRVYRSSPLLLEIAEKIEEQRQNGFSKPIAFDDCFSLENAQAGFFRSDNLSNKGNIKDLVENCKNTWIISDLGVSTLTQSDEAKFYITDRVVRNLLENCSVYAKSPERFIYTMITMVLSELNKGLS